MSELRYRGEYGHVRGVDDASRYGQAGPSTRDTSSQQANTISWQMRPVTTIICTRVLCAMWWYLSIAIAVLPPALVLLLGKRGADVASNASLIYSTPGAAGGEVAGGLLGSMERLLRIPVVSDILGSTGLPSALLIAVQSTLWARWFRLPVSRSGARRETDYGDPITLSRLFLAHALLPLIALYLLPLKGFVAVHCLTLSIYAASLLVLQKTDGVSTLWRISLSGLANLVNVLLSLRLASVTAPPCLGVDPLALALVTGFVSIAQGVTRRIPPTFSVPALHMRRADRLLEALPFLLRRAALIAAAGAAGAAGSLWLARHLGLPETSLAVLGGRVCAEDPSGFSGQWLEAAVGPRGLALLSLAAVTAASLLCGEVADFLVQIWLTQGISLQDPHGSSDEQRLVPLLQAVLQCSAAPSAAPKEDSLSGFHFIRVLAFQELDQAIRGSPPRFSLLFRPGGEHLFEPLLAKHLEVLQELCDALRDITLAADRAMQKLAAQSTDRRAAGSELLALGKDTTTVLQSTDLHVQCVYALSSLMAESQREFRAARGVDRLDRRGMCDRVLGPVLCHLLEACVRLEELARTDAYVPTAVKVALNANQMARAPAARLAAALDLSIYRIVVAYYTSIPEILGRASADCAAWVPWSASPQRAWKELYLPRLQSYLAFSSSVLPAGVPVLESDYLGRPVY